MEIHVLNFTTCKAIPDWKVQISHRSCASSIQIFTNYIIARNRRAWLWFEGAKFHFFAKVVSTVTGFNRVLGARPKKIKKDFVFKLFLQISRLYISVHTLKFLLFLLILARKTRFKIENYDTNDQLIIHKYINVLVAPCSTPGVRNQRLWVQYFYFSIA